MVVRFNNNNNSDKRHFIGFVEFVIGPTSEILFFVYENEPSTTFNLRQNMFIVKRFVIAKTSKTHKTPTQKR